MEIQPGACYPCLRAGNAKEIKMAVHVGGITTTEVCNISCVMCHFNGPHAIRKAGTLDPADVHLFLSQLPPGQHVPFASTGEFFMDPHALGHLRAAVEFGHQPSVLTNGLLLTPPLIDEILGIGVRFIAISVDAIDHDQYSRIRRGGDFQAILDACSYLRSKKAEYPDIRVEINNVLFKATFHRQQEYIDFWRGKVDGVSFNAEYHDTFKFRNTLFDRGERVDCQIRAFLLPSGKISPCCAMTVYQHDHDVSWLPHVREMPLDKAQDYLQEMYNDPESPLGQLCKGCDWWILFKHNQRGESPYLRTVSFNAEADGETERHSRELAGAGSLARTALDAVGRLLRPAPPR